MKTIIMNLFPLIAVMCLFVPANGATSTNDIAVAILSYAAVDNEDDIDVDKEYPVRYTDWNGLLDNVMITGATRQDKENALFTYLINQSTNDFANIDNEEKELIRIGLCECRDLNKTNALQFVRNLMMNPSAGFMGESVYVYYKWAPINDDYLAVTRTLLTNRTQLARSSRPFDFLLLEESLCSHQNTHGKDALYTNVVDLIYETRNNCPECAVVMDRFFISNISGYDVSSNRLSTVMSWLSSDLCPDFVRTYCSSVTNQLMNAVQPLPELESLREL